MQRLETMDELEAAVRRLVGLEPRFASVVERHGLPPLRHAPPGLECLLRIVTDQLISLKAGEAIWARLLAHFGEITPQAVAKASAEELRALGLSSAKSRTFHAAAAAFGRGPLSIKDPSDPQELEALLLEIPGVGPWTASIYLLMAMRVADAWPAADLALQVAAQDLMGLPQRPTARIMVELGTGWRPYRSAAALLLWQHYRGLRGLPKT